MFRDPPYDRVNFVGSRLKKIMVRNGGTRAQRTPINVCLYRTDRSRQASVRRASLGRPARSARNREPAYPAITQKETWPELPNFRREKRGGRALHLPDSGKAWHLDRRGYRRRREIGLAQFRVSSSAWPNMVAIVARGINFSSAFGIRPRSRHASIYDMRAPMLFRTTLHLPPRSQPSQSRTRLLTDFSILDRLWKAPIPGRQ